MLDLVFAVSALFHDQVLFLCMLSVGIMHTSLAMLIVFESRGFRKTCIQFSNNTFPIGTVIMSLGKYIRGI